MEVDSPVAPEDWSPADRERFTARWHASQLALLCRANQGGEAEAKAIAVAHYKTIVQRAAFYDWFDQVRAAQGHDIVWPGTAWIVASQFARFDTIGNAIKLGSVTPPLSDRKHTIYVRSIREELTSYGTLYREWQEAVLELDPGRALQAGDTYEALVRFANDGNRTIFEDVYSRHLPPVFRRGLAGGPLKESEARAWDEKMVCVEQTKIVQPVYVRHGVGGRSRIGHVLNELMRCEDVVRPMQMAVGAADLCRDGFDVTDPDSRKRYGIDVVVPYYRKLAADGTLARVRQAQEVRPVSPVSCLPAGPAKSGR